MDATAINANSLHVVQWKYVKNTAYSQLDHSIEYEPVYIITLSELHATSEKYQYKMKWSEFKCQVTPALQHEVKWESKFSFEKTENSLYGIKLFSTSQKHIERRKREQFI